MSHLVRTVFRWINQRFVALCLGAMTLGVWLIVYATYRFLSATRGILW